MEYSGKVVSGLKEGSKYIKIYKDRIKKKLGIIPYEGTLNITGLSDKINFKDTEKIKIDKFNGFGSVEFIKCSIKKENIEISCYVVVPEKSIHKHIEIISELNLREEMKLSDGDVITLII